MTDDGPLRACALTEFSLLDLSGAECPSLAIASAGGEKSACNFDYVGVFACLSLAFTWEMQGIIEKRQGINCRSVRDKLQKCPIILANVPTSPCGATTKSLDLCALTDCFGKISVTWVRAWALSWVARRKIVYNLYTLFDHLGTYS